MIRSQLLRLELLLEAPNDDPLFAGKTPQEIEDFKKAAKIAFIEGQRAYKREKEDDKK